MSVGLENLQRRFQTALSDVGYSGPAARLPPEAGRNERLLRFVEWSLQAIQPANHLSTAELERFKELKSSGKILEGEELESALSRMGHTQEEEQEEDIRHEVVEMGRLVSSLKSQLQNLNHVQRMLNDQYACLAHEHDDLAQQQSECQRRYQKAMETAEEDNTKINTALADLTSAVQEVCAFHRGEGSSTHPPPTSSKNPPPTSSTLPPPTSSTLPPPASSFLSAMPQEAYHAAEDSFLAELTGFTRKQFFHGIAVLAHSQEDSYGVVDLGENIENVLLKGVSQEEYQRRCQELQRLQSVYPLTEVQCINALVGEQHALAVCTRAEEEVASLSQQRAVLDHNTLRQQIKVKQSSVSELRSQLQDLGQAQLPGLLQDMATLQITKILHGDYDLKIIRQDYFISKQDKVISRLQSQRARQQLLSMLYEVELRRHRETHRLLSAAGSQLTQWRDERQKRSRAMQSASLLPVKQARQTIDSRDKFAQRLCHLLGVQSSSAASLLTHASLQSAVEQLAHQITTMEALLAAHLGEQQRITSEQQALTREFEREVFGARGSDKPQLPLEEFEEECSKLRKVVETLEQNVKSLLKDYDSKMKLLQANPLLEKERLLFAYFFTNPSKLSQVVGELARRVDALAAARKID